MALVDGEVEVEGHRVWPIGSFKQHIYSMLIAQLSGLPLPTDGQQVLSTTVAPGGSGPLLDKVMSHNQ